MGTGGTKGLDRAEVAGPVDDDSVAGIEETARDEVQSLLGAGNDQDLFRANPGAGGDRPAQERLTLGR